MNPIARVTARIDEIRARMAQLDTRPPAVSTGRALGAAVGSSFAERAAAAEAALPASPVAEPGAMRPPEMARSGVEVNRFARDVLTGIGAPVTAANMDLISAWVKAEGTRAQFNPLATTRRAEGATNFNSVGVKNFVSYEQGVQKTIEVLGLGYYTEVVAALRRGDDAYAVADAIAASPWGTGGLVRTVLESRDVPGR